MAETTHCKVESLGSRYCHRILTLCVQLLTPVQISLFEGLTQSTVIWKLQMNCQLYY